MKVFLCFAVLACITAFSSIGAFAQPAAPAQEAPKETVKVSGVMYLQWLKEVERMSEGENRNGFDVQRVYLNFTYRIDEIWSTRATLDVGTIDNGGNDERYQAFLKFAYVQAAPDLGFGRLTLQAGMIGTSILGLIDKQSDFRWISQNFVDSSNLVLHNQEEDKLGQLSSRISYGPSGQSLDTSADLGVGVSLNVAKLVTLDLQVTNGEGFKKTNDITTNDDGKAYLAMVTITPVEGLYAAGYYRYLVTNDAEAGDNYVNYYGGSVIFMIRGIRMGVSYVTAEVRKVDFPAIQATMAKYTLLDAFIMANLKSLTGVPVLLAGRYTMGATTYDEGYTVNGLEAEAVVWAAGIGYQINDKVRVMAYLEEQNSSSDDIPAADWDHANRNFWVKMEVSF